MFNDLPVYERGYPEAGAVVVAAAWEVCSVRARGLVIGTCVGIVPQVVP